MSKGIREGVLTEWLGQYYVPSVSFVLESDQREDWMSSLGRLWSMTARLEMLQGAVKERWLGRRAA